MNQEYKKGEQSGRSGGRDLVMETQAEKQQPRRNPRIVIGSLDYFDMLLEQDEQG